jgi:spore germination cell wall hydrolase CwlJ-like protein
MNVRHHLVKPGPIVLSLAIVLGVTGVSAGHELFGRLTLRQPQAVRAVEAAQPSAEDQQALAALATVEAQPEDPNAALRINASLPYSKAPVEAARPFYVPAGRDQATALDCMTAAVYYEAGFEPVDGERAVAQVILNRLRHPAFPKTVCGVIYQGAPYAGCQFSFACDGSLANAPAPAAWRRARQIAAEALRGRVMAAVGEATHYHANYVAPYWAPKLAKVTQIGAHIFYRWPGSWGRPGAFTGRYAGGERGFDKALLVRVSNDTPVAQPVDPTDRHAPADVGGRLDTTTTWRLSVPSPTESSSAMAMVLSGQGGAAPAPTPTTTAAVARPANSEG